jgi:sugar lactone lactonase YvrE
MIRRMTVAALCAAALALLAPMTASAAHPLRYTIRGLLANPHPTPEEEKHSETLEGPCGAAVDSTGNLYVSDYYRDKIVVFSSAGEYRSQITGVNPVNGPCGLAIDGAGVIYANLLHGGIAVLEPVGGGYTNRGEVLSIHATGVAIDPATGNLLVDERTAVAEYELPLTEGETPLRTIGVGSLGDGYGVAVTDFAGTGGRVYVADAAAGKVKAYDPATSFTTPVAELDGTGTTLGRFNDLTDAALALDDSDGHLYVADNLSGQLFEQPQAGIQEFDPAGSFEGQLEPKSIDGDPVGLAVDNTDADTQGDIYVTSGNSEGSVVYAFGPSTPSSAAPFVPDGGGSTTGATVQGVAAGPAPTSSTSSKKAKTAATSTIAQKGTLRVQLQGEMNPKMLPRQGSKPVSVSVSAHVTTTNGNVPPQLRVLTIDINRKGTFDLTGLPLCPLHGIRPASSSRALSACSSSLVGEGHFQGETSLSGERTEGRLLLFNGRRHGRPVLFGQIYSTKPFTSSYVVTFSVRHLPHGTYGTELQANLAASLGTRERLTGIEITLSRRYRYQGEMRSVISAGCPAPKGFPSAVFPLLRATFSFDGPSLSSTLSGNCQARH